MDLTTVETILIAIAPSVSAILTMIGGIVFMFRKIKATVTASDLKVQKSESKLEKAYKDIAIIKAKCESMEKTLIEQKEKETH